jgi:pyrimidine-nucleoside phosphorylase
MSAPTHRAVDLIGVKRDGGALDEDALRWLVDGYLQTATAGEGPVSEGQMAAFLMAGVLRGFSDEEALALTRVLAGSGDTLDLSDVPGPTVDKHSTGGVGDGTTLLVAPLAAAAGAYLVKLSGRGLGHTGGTLDKLEAIPGFRVDLDADELLDVARDVGCVVAAQSRRLVPADGALYALRDVTGTVASRALIASSVMSKKLAAGAETVVLDVKAGDGAFMPTADDARGLAALCVRIGADAGRRCVALVTAMDEPLGRRIGNALEVAEAVGLLAAPPAGRLAEVALELATTGVALARGQAVEDRAAVRDELVRRWRDGEALERLARMVAAQGGDARLCERPEDVLPCAPVRRDVPVRQAGYVSALPASGVGATAAALGAGRARKQDPVDPAVGVDVHVEIGDAVAEDSRFVTIHARSEDDADGAEQRLTQLLSVAETAVPRPATILDLVVRAP